MRSKKERKMDCKVDGRKEEGKDKQGNKRHREKRMDGRKNGMVILMLMNCQRR